MELSCSPSFQQIFDCCNSAKIPVISTAFHFKNQIDNVSKLFQQQICNGHKLDDCIPEVSGLESSTSSVPFLEGTPPPPPPAMFGSCEPSDVPQMTVDAPPPSYSDTLKQPNANRGYCHSHNSHDECHESLESDYSDEVTFPTFSHIKKFTLSHVTVGVNL